MIKEFSFINELFRIVNGALRLDIDKVRNYTAFLADKLVEAGDDNSATRLRKLLQESDHQLRPAKTSLTAAMPVDEESRFPLLEKVNLRELDEPDIVLSDTQTSAVTEFLSVTNSHAQLEAEGLKASVSMLLFGPPGCGKSHLARYIARHLGLDLYIARLDGLISSYLGSTSKNIRALFEFASRTPCVLFLDEFDALAKLRGDTQELGELKRVVNSFIQNLDSLGTQSVVLAATNHHELLDAAVWRRFSYRIEMGYPNEKIRTLMWHKFLQPLPFSEKDIALINDLSDGFSGSDIQEVCLRLHRRRVMFREQPKLKDVVAASRAVAIGEGETRRFLASLKAASSPEIAAALRQRSPKLYSYAALGRLLGVSKPTAYRWTQEKFHG